MTKAQREDTADRYQAGAFVVQKQEHTLCSTMSRISHEDRGGQG